MTFKFNEIFLNIFFKAKLYEMLPKVRRGEAEYSKIEEILNDFKKEDGYSDKIKEFNEKCYEDWRIKDFLRLIKLEVSGFDTDLRSLFYDNPNSDKIIFFYSDELKSKNETDWIDCYDFFLKYVQKKKKNEKLFCCNIELNTDIKNINNICVIKYDSTDKEQILFLIICA